MPVSNIPMYSDGIYFEELKTMKVQASTWTLRAEYDILQFVAELATANRTVFPLLEACAKMQSSSAGNCEGIGDIRELNSELNEFSTLLKSFCEETADESPASRRRARRGILRSWFGLMDDTDREHIHDNFTRVNQQLAIESSTLKLFYNTTNQALAALSGNIFKIDPKRPQTIDFTREGQLLLMDILLNKIIAKKNLFMQLLQSTTSDRLSDSIITPNRLLAELQKVQKFLPLGFRFPVEMNLREVLKLYALSKVAAYVEGCRLVVHILIPLCNRSTYRTFKGTPIPSIDKNRQLLSMIVLDQDVLAVDEATSTGILLSFEEYKQCQHLNDFAFCNVHRVVRNLTTAEECLAATYFNRTHHGSNCRVSRIQINHQLWLQLANPNDWIYVMPNYTDITIQHSADRVNALTLHGVGMLRLLRMCHVQSQDVWLQYVPQLGGNKIRATKDSTVFALPVTITREQSLAIGSSTGDSSRIIPVGHKAEAALLDSSVLAGVYREPATISPWVICGIVFGASAVLLLVGHVFGDKCQWFSGLPNRMFRREEVPAITTPSHADRQATHYTPNTLSQSPQTPLCDD
ncbi:uncharacterized protein LOC128272848 [Anopheles cruzii]|uniref:uncharacterized protein LOC128272848 n=1 Tax=Anopheles cruzii TaxID=68878 RepID=UPI0022EC3646|nr:uncharacterized protein LOC128272848 [Anopheles cruzii]